MTLGIILVPMRDNWVEVQKLIDEHPDGADGIDALKEFEKR